MRKKMEGDYTTKDFYLAAHLRASGLELIGANRSNPHQVFFVFADSKAREKLVDDFLFGRASVNSKAFISAIQALKQLIHSDA